MREKKKFAERSSKSENLMPKKKFFLVFEGEKTESIYFNAIEKYREKLMINSVVQFIPIIRDFSEKGYSNPKKIIECLDRRLLECKTGISSYDTICNCIINYLDENNLMSANNLSKKMVWATLENILNERGKKICDQVVDLKKACDFLYSELCNFSWGKVLSNLDNMIQKERLSYEAGFDKMCIVVDRDKESFTSKQFKEVLEECGKKKYSLYVSNPCFEFWLLLHYDGVTELDKNKLKENAKVSKNKRYVELELHKKMNGYKKTKYDDSIALNVDKAIKNMFEFCYDEEKLIDSVGTNLGRLIEELRS